MKILLAGGGTLGPVTPLFALVEAWRKKDASVSFVLVGTSYGPERALAKHYDVGFLSLPLVRFPRFVSFEWLWLPFRFLQALISSVKLLRRQRPEMIIGAGGFTQVPLIFVGRLFGIPSVVLQTDVYPLLSNRLVAPFVDQIYLGWKEGLGTFLTKNITTIGVPVRYSLKDGSRERAMKRFDLVPFKPTLLVFGGGTGSVWINEMMAQIAAQLKKEMNVIHITGQGKNLQILQEQGDGYVAIEQVDGGMEDIYAVADVVVARAGSGTLSELSALKKAAIIIPLPGSTQEKNAQIFAHQEGALVLNQKEVTAELLLQNIRSMLDPEMQKNYQQRIGRVLLTDVADEMIQDMQKYSSQSKRHAL